MQRGRRVAVVGVKNKLLVQSLRFLPRRTITGTVKRMQAPRAE
jgi:hypothetical protein